MKRVQGALHNGGKCKGRLEANRQASEPEMVLDAATQQAEGVFQGGVQPCVLPVSYCWIYDARVVVILKRMRLLAVKSIKCRHSFLGHM